MHFVIRCRTARFDLAAEPPNPFNPIAGRSLLVWFSGELGETVEFSEPEPEDWGWCCLARCGERRYLVGACATPSADGWHEWLVQVERERSTIDRLCGRARMTPDDACVAAIRDLLTNEATYSDVTVEFVP